MLIALLIFCLDEAEYFPDHSKTVDGLNVINFTLKEWSSGGSDILELFGRILIIIDSTSVGQGIMHCQFLLQVSDFFFISFNCYCWVYHWIDNSLILNLHHSCGELKSGDGFFKVRLNAMDVGDDDGLAVSTKGVSQEVGKCGLPIWHMISLLIWEGENDLLQVWKTLVNVSCLNKLWSFGASLLDSLWTRQIN